MTINDLDNLRSWVGRSVEAADLLDPARCRLMQATLDQPTTAAHFQMLPPLWHWLFFPSETATSDLAEDGHARVDPLLPPVALPARMWAGGRLQFHGPLRLGELVWRHSEIWDVKVKQGRSGPLCFITVRHDYSVDDEVRVSEEHDIVYRQLPEKDVIAEGPPAPVDADISREIVPSSAWLFRYSALTFNSHRIHYDHDFCRDVEGYPGLLVHGPLTATLLADLAQTVIGPLASFNFRATAPLFGDKPFTVNAKRQDAGLSLWAATSDGKLAMTAEAVAL